MYQFLDQESNAGAGTVGSYLGRKRVFNIGGGVLYQPQGVWHTTQAGDTVRQAIKLFAVDVYYDAPLDAAKGTALTAYAGYFHYDFGPGYLRSNGVMNPANGVRASQASFNGPATACRCWAPAIPFMRRQATCSGATCWANMARCSRLPRCKPRATTAWPTRWCSSTLASIG